MSGLFPSLTRLVAPTEHAATLLLWIVAAIAAGIAIWGGPLLKAGAAAWLVLP